MPFPRWLSWMFIAVMAYMVYSVGTLHQAPLQPVVPIEVATSEATPVPEDYTALANATDVERWKRALNPDYGARMNCSVERVSANENLLLKVIEETVGEQGDAAKCGQEVRVALVVWNEKGGTSYQGDLSLALGSQQIAAGLDAGLIGMKIGGVRTLLLPPQALARTKESKPHVAARKALPEGKLAVVTVKLLANATPVAAIPQAKGAQKK